MRIAFEEAEAAFARGEVPVGCAVVDGDSRQIIARAGNRTEELRDPTAHAEMLALRAACAALGAPRIPGCDLYVTLEPCAMCAQAMAFARIRRVVFGADDPKMGGVLHGARVFAQPSCHHKPEVIDCIDAARSRDLMRRFFAARR